MMNVTPGPNPLIDAALKGKGPVQLKGTSTMPTSTQTNNDAALESAIESLIYEPNAPLTPEQLAVEIVFRNPRLKQKGESAMAFIKRVRALLEKNGLSSSGGAVKAGERGDRSGMTDARREAVVNELLNPGKQAPMKAQAAALSLNAALSNGPMSNERAQQVVGELRRAVGDPPATLTEGEAAKYRELAKELVSAIRTLPRDQWRQSAHMNDAVRRLMKAAEMRSRLAADAVDGFRGLLVAAGRRVA